MEHIKQELDKTRTYWTQPVRNFIHNLVSIIISQKIPFRQSRLIRQQMYQKYQTNLFTYDLLIKITAHEWQELGLGQAKIATINQVLKLGQCPNVNDLKKIKGIGSWTIKSLKIMSNLLEPNEDFFLEEDYWVRKILSKILDRKKVMTQREAKKYVDANWKDSKVELTKFLWRLKPEGAEILNKKGALSNINFL